MKKKEIEKDSYKLIEQYFKLDKIEQQNKSSSEKIGVAFPCFDHLEVNSALESLLKLQISQGDKVKKFERDFSNYIGIKKGVAVNSGSSANLLAIAALVRIGYVKKGAEVIVPAATFTTVISPIIQCGLKPVFVDIDKDTYNIDHQKIKNAITKDTGLIMPVHSLGLPADMDSIMDIANEKGIPVLEDCCEAHGSSIGGRKVGSYGIANAFSFFVAHNMTSGEGGMVLTNDARLDNLMRSMREFGRLINNSEEKERFHYSDNFLSDYDERYVFKYIGYNIRMTDIAASLGIEQLKKLDEFNMIRVENAKKLTSRLSNFKHIKLPKTPKDYFHSYYGYTVLIKNTNQFSRKDLVNHLENDGIETRAFMGGNLSKQPAYRDEVFRISGDLLITDNIEEKAFFIGCHPFMGDPEVERIADSFDSFFRKILN